MLRTQHKAQRYDRQIRLWGDHGQSAIEDARVCLIRASALGAELMKNLVLPGIGGFTIIDDACVSQEDLGSNFFLSEKHLNKARAQAVTELLLELNGEVCGHYLIEDVNDLIENEPQFFLSYSIIVVTDAREGILIRLSQILEGSSIPLVICTSVGMIGYMRISTAEHVIIESHPDSFCPDLRLDCPFPELTKLANERPLELMDSDQLSHTPWLIIVYLYVQKFISLHGHFPQNHKEKTEVKNMISKGALELWENLRSREPNLDRYHALENFEEACRAVNTAVHPTEIPVEIQKLLQDVRCDDSFNPVGFSDPHNLKSKISSSVNVRHQPSQNVYNISSSSTITNINFWRLVRALKDFIEHEGEGQLPVRGVLPDMTSDSKSYLKLLTIYRERSEWAVERLASRLAQFPEITLDDIRVFVRNAAFLNVVRSRSLEEEMKLSPARSEDLNLIPTHEENDALLWYIILRGASSFLSETGRWPGSSYFYVNKIRIDTDRNFSQTEQTNSSNTSRSKLSNKLEQSECRFYESDLPAFRNNVNRVLRSFGIASNRVSTDYLEEMCRFGGGELHSVVAFMGGVVSQEVIKLITHQFIPVMKPLIYNAITHRVELLEF